MKEVVFQSLEHHLYNINHTFIRGRIVLCNITLTLASFIYVKHFGIRYLREGLTQQKAETEQDKGSQLVLTAESSGRNGRISNKQLSSEYTRQAKTDHLTHKVAISPTEERKSEGKQRCLPSVDF